MSLETLFSLSNAIALIGWLLLALLPRWYHTTKLVTSVAVPLLLGLAYAFLIVTEFGKAGAGFGSLEQVAILFQNRALLLAGWIHYLAFDLFIGSWEVRDAQRLGINHWFVVPCLFFTFMLGPIGLLLYLILRLATKNQLIVET